MSVNFSEALKELKNQSKNNVSRKIKLVNGEVVEGVLESVYVDMIVVSKPTKGAGSPKYTIPVKAILYISDCELP